MKIKRELNGVIFVDERKEFIFELLNGGRAETKAMTIEEAQRIVQAVVQIKQLIGVK
jgi:hypothetical protein